MYLPKLHSSRRTVTQVSDNFGGLNRSEAIADNEFRDMKNCGNFKFPFISKRESRNILQSFDDEIKYCLPPIDSFDEEITGFTGICGDKFYYRGAEKNLSEKTIDRIPYPYNDAELYPELADKVSARSFTKFGNVYYSYPQFTYYNSYEQNVSNPNWSYTFDNLGFRVDSNGNVYLDYCPESYASSLSLEINGKPITSTNAKVGDRITIHYSTDVKHNNCTVDASCPDVRKTLLEEYNSSDCAIVSAYIQSINFNGDGELINFVVELYDIKGNKIKPTNSTGTGKLIYKSSDPLSAQMYFEKVRVSKYVPEIIYTCEFAGRVFGLDAYGEYIYASKLNAPLNFTQYDGLADSSWYTEIDSSGEWTGMIVNSSHLYCFKRDRVYVLYGDNAKNFSVAKNFGPGCVDGRSICIVNNNIYFMASDGIYVYGSGVPQKISEKLGRWNYKEGICCGYGSLLYACLKNDEGSELFVFDTDKGIWYRHDDIDIVGFYVHNNKLYGATKHDFICFGDGCEDFEYSVTSKLFTDATSYMRSIVSLYFRLKLGTNSEATVYISYDGGDWQKCGHIENGKLYDTNSSKSVADIAEEFDEDKLHKPGCVYSQRVPVRFRAASTYQYKIVCRGNVVIEAIERDVGVNGRAKR